MSVDEGQRGSHLPPQTFALCLLPFAFCLLLSPWASPGARVHTARAPLSDDEADDALQRAARSALGGRDGSVLVLDAQTGRVRAAVNPLGVFEDATPPGSAVKPFTMLAALRSHSIDAETRLSCRGRYEHEEFRINCSHPRYERAFGPAQALANSCNYFFGSAARTLDPEAYTRTLSSFGFGARTGGDARESAGQLPHTRPGVAEMLGDSAELRVTPAQLLTAYAALFNGGRLLAPLRARAEGFGPSLRASVEVEPEHRALILEGMRGAVAYGTASRAGLATLPAYVFGKTGTSTPLEGWRAQGWFVGLATDERARADAPPSEAAPPERVRLAVLVFLRRSRGSEAAEIARPVFEAYARTLAGPAHEDVASSASSSNSEVAAAGDEEGADSDAEGGAKVRVRLTRADRTAALHLEDYVFGVLAAEGSVETEAEALKALAVVARTYAFRNLRRHARDGYDLCDTTHCQRFAGVADESARPDFYALARRAVRETEGELLRDSSGRVAEVYFSAACGGHTADLSKLWGARESPAQLRGVRDEACDALEENWTDFVPAANLLRALRADARSDVGSRLDAVRVVRRDRTGRAEEVALEGERARRLRGWDFKIIVGRTLGWSKLKSSRFDVTRAGSSFVFRGRGFGHGLGLCQTGAHVSAARGAGYRQILARYFPSTNVGAREPRAVTQATDARPASLRQEGFGQESFRQAPLQQPDFQQASLREVSFEQASLQQAVFQPASFRHASFHPRPSRPAPPPEALASQAGRGRSTLRGEHFRLSYPSRVARGEAEELMRSLESARADVLRRVERAGLPPLLPNLEVVVYETTGDFVGATGRPAWVAAVTGGGRVELQPLEVLRRRGLLSTTPRHELVHAALDALGRGRAPLWLAEGLASYVAGEGPRLSRGGAARRMPVEELERRLARPNSAEEMRALYAAAYAEVSALVRREGEQAAWRLALR